MSEPNKSIIPPTIHRMEGELKVCDPVKTDHTRDMESWRILKIMDELVTGFDLLKKYRLAATFFGSAREHLNPRYYAEAEALAGKLAQSGFTVITGGAGGIMQSANKGAHDAGGNSIGLNIKLPHEQAGNPYATEEYTFNYFFTRRVMLSFASEVYIFFPGGYGTLDEFFEIATLVQTNKIKRIPIILYGAEYWNKLQSFLENEVLEAEKAIDAEDLKLYHIADDVDDAYEKILTLVKC